MNTDPCILVILGASGDLAKRKLIPSMAEMSRLGLLNPKTVIVGVSRTPKRDDEWRDELLPWVREHASGFDEHAWSELARRIFYHAGDATKPEVYPGLTAQLDELAREHGTHGNILFYLSVAPELYEPIVSRIDEAGLVTEGRRWCSVDPSSRSWQRIVVEKPFGSDDESAASLNRALGRVFDEEAIYRIDHYLGKGVVQGLLALRFANTIFEPVWNQRYIDHVQITAAETVGVGQRIGFYDGTGAIRDMIQSHLLQILTFVAMEPPTLFRAEHIRAEKVKVVDAIKMPPRERLGEFGALGQYGAGGGEPAYHLEQGVDPQSRTETFAAIKLIFDNWRWAGTPFYLRTGKKMAAKRTEIVVQFKPPAANLFREVIPAPPEANRMIIEIAPHERFRLRFEGKEPGQGFKLTPMELIMDYREQFNVEPLEAYGPLIIDAMRGDQSLYKHRMEVEGAWRAVMPFIGPESEPLRRSIHANYAPGSWGPETADAMLARDGRRWHNPR
ncbi:MAG: glucose-6-phosphate dehydrogenase [Phycisphaeraceae bacterium]|nr:glucose-6-phosphate dehydrogenase [Phycisphaeraceae bacterium]